MRIGGERVRRGGRAGTRVLVALVAALCLHAGALLLVHLVGPALLREPATMPSVATNASADDPPMEISSLVDSLAEPDRPTREEAKREEDKKKEEERKDPKGQIVDIAKPAIEQHPDEARFLSEYDSKVEREQRGKTGNDKAGAKVQATVAAPPAPAAAAREAGHGGRAGAPGEAQPTLAMREPSRHDGHDGLPVAEDGEMQRRTGASHEDEAAHAVAAPARTPSAQGERGDGRAAGEASSASTPRPNLAATPEMLERAIGAGAGSMDYLKDLDDGDSTALNAKKWKHAPFFNRLKRAVAQEWHPDMLYVRHDPSGNVYGVKDRVTVLRVHLQPDGRLAGTNVVQSSGVDFLDDEAAAALKRAQPFANPPKELVEADGQIHFTFGFVFELSGHASFKVYKYR